ncbi:hypothetical protein V8F20_003559 [Naviculisporaceae sp. PSN 640]
MSEGCGQRMGQLALLGCEHRLLMGTVSRWLDKDQDLRQNIFWKPSKATCLRAGGSGYVPVDTRLHNVETSEQFRFRNDMSLSGNNSCTPRSKFHSLTSKSTRSLLLVVLAMMIDGSAHWSASWPWDHRVLVLSSGKRCWVFVPEAFRWLVISAFLSLYPDLHLGSAVRQVRLGLSTNPVASLAHKSGDGGHDAAGPHDGLWSASAYCTCRQNMNADGAADWNTPPQGFEMLVR